MFSASSWLGPTRRAAGPLQRNATLRNALHASSPGGTQPYKILGDPCVGTYDKAQYQIRAPVRSGWPWLQTLEYAPASANYFSVEVSIGSADGGRNTTASLESFSKAARVAALAEMLAHPISEVVCHNASRCPHRDGGKQLLFMYGSRVRLRGLVSPAEARIREPTNNTIALCH